MLTSLRDSISDRMAPILTWFHSFPRTHRILIAASGAVGAALVVMLLVVAVTWATGGFTPSLTSEVERNLIMAEREYDAAVKAANTQGITPENFPAAIDAQANVIVALVDAGRLELALDAADELRENAPESARALYAIAYAYSKSDLSGYTSQVRDIYAQAAAAVAESGASTALGRAISVGYGRVLAQAGSLDLAAENLARAAAIEPASAEIYLELAAVEERAEDWQGAAFAYAAALAYDPLMIAAQEGLDRIAEAHPAEAQAALESPELPGGGMGD